MSGGLFLRLRKTVRRPRRDQDGQGMVEYALILLLIALVVIVLLTVTGGQVSNTFSSVANSFNTS